MPDNRTIKGDPDLSERSEEILTDELRDATGRDDVRVRAGSPATATAADRTGPAGGLAGAAMPLGIAFAVLVVVGAIIGLATGSWWALVAAVAVHAVGTLVIASGAVRLTTAVEHVSPDRAAALQEEGIIDPDRALGELVAEVAQEDVSEHPATTVAASDAEPTPGDAATPAQSTAAQSASWTPSHRSHAVGPGDDAPPGVDPGRGDDDPRPLRVGIPAILVVVGVVGFMVLMGVIVGAL